MDTATSRAALSSSTVLLVAAGGAVGALARVALSTAFPVGSDTVPWNTLAENLSGAFLLGVLVVVVHELGRGPAWAFPLLGTGLLGAYTTFATLGLELHRLAASDHLSIVVTYTVVSLVGGLVAAAAGVGGARALGSRRRR